MNIFLRPQSNHILLIEQRRPGTHKTHIPFQNIPQLRQFIQARFSQKGTYRCQILISIYYLCMCRYSNSYPQFFKRNFDYLFRFFFGMGRLLHFLHNFRLKILFPTVLADTSGNILYPEFPIYEKGHM